MIKYSPDLIIVSYVINDVDKHRFYRSNGKMDIELKDKHEILVNIENLLEKSNLIRLIKKIITKYQSVSVRYFGVCGKNNYIIKRRVSPEDYRKNLKSIINIAEKNDIKVILLKMPINLPSPQNVSKLLQLKSDSHIEKGLLLVQANEYNKSVEEFKKAVDCNPYSSKAFYYLGVSYEKIKRTKEAHGCFKKTTKMELYECAKLGKMYNAIMKEIANEEKVVLVEIDMEFDRFYKKNNTYLFLDPNHDTIHPNNAGHAIISRAIYEAIRENII